MLSMNSLFFYKHWSGQGGQLFSSHQLLHQRVGLWVEVARLRGQQARLGGVAEQVRQELVMRGHGGVNVLVPQGCRVAVHFSGATGSTQRSKVTVMQILLVLRGQKHAGSHVGVCISQANPPLTSP